MVEMSWWKVAGLLKLICSASRNIGYLLVGTAGGRFMFHLP